MSKTSSLYQNNPLAIAQNQLQVLTPAKGQMAFRERLPNGQLTARRPEILQINLGKMCNMTCAHCHVDAGPDRKEIMSRGTIDQCLSLLASQPEIATVDLTGGAPEMNPHFRHVVESARRMGRHVIDRCNLTILLANGFEDLAEFLAAQRVEIVASLPCYLEENTDAQRGTGAFSRSIRALRRLNELGLRPRRK